MTHTATADFSMNPEDSARMPKKSRLAEIFGELADPKFYLHLIKVAIAEVIKAAVLTFAGTVAWYVQSKITTSSEMPSFRSNAGGGGSQPTVPSYMGQSRALQGSERESYLNGGRQTYGQVNNFKSPTSENFPGFGDR